MRVSVIIPTYNRAQLLPRAVASLLAQDWRPLEIVIIDDGSDDETPEVIRRLNAQAADANVEFLSIRQSNEGDASARNKGLHAASGDWIGFLDDDDVRREGTITAQLKVVASAQACCGLVQQGVRTKPASAERLLSDDCGAAFLRGEQSAAITSLLVRREVVDAVGDFDQTLPIGSDMEWISRVAHHADFATLPNVVADYNHTERALSRYSGIGELIKRDTYDLRVVDLIRERCHTSPQFSADAWCDFAARTYDRCIKHLLYSGRTAEAETLLETALAKGANPDTMKRTRRKLRKAKLLAAVGRRLPHPKFANIDDVRG